MGMRKRPPLREGWHCYDHGKAYEWAHCRVCDRFVVHFSHPRCQGCRVPRECGAKGWRVCRFGTCGRWCPSCEPQHRPHCRGANG